MKIEYNGSEWGGTFQTLLRTLVTDVAKDGPFEATLTWDEDGEPMSATMQVLGVEVPGNYLSVRVPMGTVRVEIERILALEVL